MLLDLGSLFDVLNQSVARIFHQVKHMLEALGTAVIGVGHDGAVEPNAELGQSMDFVPVLRGGTRPVPAPSYPCP